jgi:Xaa-Pro dipeptidase
MTRLEEVLIKENRLRGMMEGKGLDGILLKKQPNFSWLTAGGLNMVGIATEMGMTSLLVTRTGRYVFANRIEAPRMMNEERLGELGFQLLEYEWHVDREAELVRKAGGDLNKIGADVRFGSCQNMDGDIKRLRFSLTESEMERYRFLGERLSHGLEKIMLGIRPGDSESEIAGRVGVELWKDRIDPTGFQVAADDRAYTYRHPIPTTRMIKRYVMVCVNARYKGLITTITRILHFGKPDPKLVRQFSDNNEIECRMIEATQPGVPASVPFDVGLKAYKELGYEKEWQLHHQGGAMGYLGRDSKVTRESTEIIEENQAFCWNPSITGTKTEDGFIATKRGPIMITGPVIYPKIEYNKGGVHLLRPGLMVLD